MKRLLDLFRRGEPDRAGPDGAGEAAELRVLMVCMGNICRSPTAEAVLRHKLQQAGLAARVEVDSAGTTGYHAGEPPDPRAIRHAAQRGYALDALRARALEGADFERFDWVLAMDDDNLQQMQRRAPPGAPARVRLLLEYARRFAGERELPDPYYGPPDGFEQVLDRVEDACDGLLERLRVELDAMAGAGGAAGAAAGEPADGEPGTSPWAGPRG